MSDTTVLIVGGSLNGLTLALLLARRGVPCVVVERHPDTTLQYKFRGISPRSMETYRMAGVEADIRARDQIDDASAYVARTTNLSDPNVSWQGVPWSDTSDIGPTNAATCDQDLLEPILRAHAERHGADVRFNTELTDWRQTAGGVTARVRDRVTGRETTIEAQYLVAADGAQSGIRETLRIGRHGPGVVQHWMNIIFETDLPTTLEGRTIRSVFVTDVNGALVPRGDGRWLMATQYLPARGERAGDFTEDRCRELIRKAAGRDDVIVRVIDARPWEAAAAIADRFREGRVFLVGDSAHVMPPTGGFGGNTGIQDTVNLAWKLDAVLEGAAGPGLLDTYDEERRPVADATMAQSLARLQAWFKDPAMQLPPPVPLVEDNAVLFGYRYASGAFVPERDQRVEAFEDPRHPSSAPGARAPQLMLEAGGLRQSSIDRFAGRWVVLAGPDGSVWLDTVLQHYAAAAFDLQCHRLDAVDGLRDVEHRWTRTYGNSAGAVLIRPDGFIAWRGRDASVDARASLDRALERLQSVGSAFK